MFEKERGTYAERFISASDEITATRSLQRGRKRSPEKAMRRDFRYARRRVANVSRDRRTGADVRAKIACESIRGDVNAIQIGNHPDWPAMFLASLRKRLLVLPLDKSVSAQERDNCDRDL